jgi:hypothetical protein
VQGGRDVFSIIRDLAVLRVGGTDKAREEHRIVAYAITVNDWTTTLCEWSVPVRDRGHTVTSAEP